MEKTSVKPEMETNPIAMSFEEIKGLYPDAWVLIGNPEYDEKKLHIVAGTPLLQGKDKREVYYYGKHKKQGFSLFTVVFTGESQKAPRHYMTGIWRSFK